MYLIGLVLVITFSRTAWMAGIILILVAYLTQTKLVRGLPVLIIVVLALPLILGRSPSVYEAAFLDRAEGAVEAVALLQQLPLWHGGGPGNYEHLLRHYLDSNSISYEAWHIAPVHNVVLLLLVEWGILPALLLGFFFIYYYGANFRRTWPWLLPVIPLVWLDHYLLTQLAPLVYLVTVLLFVSDQKHPIVDQPSITPTPLTPQ